ncbi:hypothetical protein GGTG_02002 [Gaeumannomyces tritici R3-111a-1]|uniref:Uncharacterized protein n=1 Tax=Gaeumannomyces tritici (strain R3-111a-1) TaxID=644352 RepID=J3NL61_GAET3|nr:hypothetical protein GGTG_02002 [Gaeumannomyces tritici R3-111a-1]EJT82028.1 hypothetical protein GGTG_02002 [Gaeumannomyces tritici R3-111a-1]
MTAWAHPLPARYFEMCAWPISSYRSRPPHGWGSGPAKPPGPRDTHFCSETVEIADDSPTFSEVIDYPKSAKDLPVPRSEMSAARQPWHYPDCMPYIVGTFADHASRGQAAGMDPTPLI